ncbi:efflux RND transporter periplasmic adaptor subunit [Paracoccus caeni]|nr:efflux RND transporter periplasmic adaptor subunit [Paracoccus caeni]
MRVLFPLLVAAGLSSAALADEAESSTETARNLPAVSVVEATRAEVFARVPVSGSLVARQQVQVFPQVSGYEITEILVEAGDTVEKGQVLARLATDTLDAQLEQARAEYARAEAGVGQARSNIDSAQASLTQATTALERVQRLRQSGNASQAVLDQAVADEANARAQAASAGDGLAVAQAALGQAQAARRIAELNRDRAAIIAPVGGVISARTAELGAMAGGGTDPLFTLIENGEIEFSAEVIETALPELATGAPATVSIAGLGEISGQVRLIPAAVDQVSRLGLMRISLEQKPGLRPGLFGNGWITTAQRQAVTVPMAAVLTDADGERVQVVVDGQIESREVRAGLLWEGRREIVEGVNEGETVLARAGAFFSDGDQIRVIDEDRSQEPDDAEAAATAETAGAVGQADQP